MSFDPREKFEFVILGGGTAGWIAANMLIRRWSEKNIGITVVESPYIGIIGVGEGSTPQLKTFFDYIGVEESEWMPRCNATYKNGITFSGWSEKPGFEHYFHPFPSQPDNQTAEAFYFNLFARRRGIDVCGHPNRYYLSAYLAENKLGPLPNYNFPFTIGYGYHFDSHLLGEFLRDLAKSRGVRHVQAKISEAVVSEEGDISHLITDEDKIISGDFFLDSSGFRSMLLQQALKIPFRSFEENLFNDAAVVLPTPADPKKVNSQTISTAMKNGWAWDIPLINRTGNGYVYSSQFCSADEAETELRQHLGLLDSDVEARHLNMRVGRAEETWRRNCLAVGLSQGFIEPLEATALHFVIATVEGFMDAFDAGGQAKANIDRFNTVINQRIEGVRDYIVCHYRVNSRTDTEYWRTNANNKNLSHSLVKVLNCWSSGGNLIQELRDQEITGFYPAMSWHCLLSGYGIFPDADKLKPPTPEYQKINMDVLDDFFKRCALNFTDHKELLKELA